MSHNRPRTPAKHASRAVFMCAKWLSSFISNLWKSIYYTDTVVRKLAEYTEAVQLRKRGFSYAEIAKLLGISKSTVSTWLSRETWSIQIREQNVTRAARDNGKRISLLNKARTNQFNKLYAEAERSAANEYKHYKISPLFNAGLMLYLAQGDLKESHQISLVSARLQTHRIFGRFAKEYLGVPREKIRFLPTLYSSTGANDILTGWAKAIDLPLTQFHKPQVLKSVHTRRPLRSGVGNTIIGGTVLKRRLMVWVHLATKEL